MTYKNLFGPVPSRRLGMSLGIDLVPHKVCTLNCVYCECGATTRLTLERKEYVPYDRIIRELNHFMDHNKTPDFFTFSGSGEPTLNSRFGEVLSYIKNEYASVPVAVLTNGTLLSREQVRSELLAADIILPSLDAGSEGVFRNINRPPLSLDFNSYISGLVDLRREYKGKIWLEVFILPGYNDTEEELVNLKETILRIHPDTIQLNTLDRPGVIDGLHPADSGQLQKIKEFWGMDSVEIIALPIERTNHEAYRKDIENTILETISRRPCTLLDIEKMVGLHKNEINKYLGNLEKDRKIESVNMERGLFYHIRKSN